ncbi:UNVERIFIED_CONTAM: hypothetical protein K2H54_001730 [Gekko kuhli]
MLAHFGPAIGTSYLGATKAGCGSIPPPSAIPFFVTAKYVKKSEHLQTGGPGTHDKSSVIHEAFLLMTNSQNEMEEWVKAIRQVTWTPFCRGLYCVAARTTSNMCMGRTAAQPLFRWEGDEGSSLHQKAECLV